MVGGIAVVASVVRLYALCLYNTSKDIPYDTILVRIDLIPRIVKPNQIEGSSAVANRSQIGDYIDICTKHTVLVP
jgi:hypothetical protein